MIRKLCFDTWSEDIQGEESHAALAALASPGTARPGEVIAHCLDVDLTLEGKHTELPRQWFVLAHRRGFEFVEFRALPDDQKPKAAIAACQLQGDATFTTWMESRLRGHINTHGQKQDGYGILSVAGAALILRENAISTLGLDPPALTEALISSEVIGAVSSRLSNHGQMEALKRLDTLFESYHMSESGPGPGLSVFLGDLKVSPSSPRRPNLSAVR